MHASDAQMKIRLPAELRDSIVSAAEENRRTLNAEIVARLEASFDAPSREEFEATKKWATEFLRAALDNAVEQIVAEKNDPA